MSIPTLAKTLWRDPVWSKVIASAIVGLFGLGYLLIHPKPSVSTKPAPLVSLALENTSAEPISILRRGDFILWLPQGVDDLRRLPGRYDLEVPKSQSTALPILVKPRARVAVMAQLHAESSLRQIMDRGIADLEFIFRKENGGILFSGSIPFAQRQIETTTWEIDLGRKQ